jgi:hypothetical protein
VCVRADNRHQSLLTVFDQTPDTAVDAFISPTATVVGRVNVQDRSSVGYGCVLRGDTNYIHVGAYSHILDGTSIQVKLDKNGAPGGTVIGNYATIGASSAGGESPSGPEGLDVTVFCCCAKLQHLAAHALLVLPPVVVQVRTAC